MKSSAPRAGWVGRVFALMSVIMLLLGGTGLVMYVLPASELMDMSELESTLRRTCGVLHGLLAWGLCVVCGRGLWPHVQLMRHHPSDRRQWVWGWINLAVLVMLALTGWGLLYGRADWHEVIASVHVWLGLLAPLPWVRHVWKRLRLRVYSNW